MRRNYQDPVYKEWRTKIYKVDPNEVEDPVVD